MTLSDITSANAIKAAVDEYDQLGPENFLQKYGFGPSRSYFLLHNGVRYPSKAIIGAAHGYEHPEVGPLSAKQFTGGEATVKKKLEELGFQVEVVITATAGEVVTSERLEHGALYTRKELRSLFDISDATINTGVFQPKGTSSLWLFVTRDKTNDRTQYQDRRDGDVLHWQGQTEGRTDRFIIEHALRGLELLVFYRESKRSHPGAGFNYLGPFEYISHSGSRPTNFILRRIYVESGFLNANAADEDEFDPDNVEDGREKIMRAITRRRGQRAFRGALLKAYEGACAVSGCRVVDVLEAAHIFPYRGPDTNKTSNGLLLRADLHTLFDCGLLSVDEEKMTVIVTPRLRHTEYGKLNGAELRMPKAKSDRPSKTALMNHRADAGL